MTYPTDPYQQSGGYPPQPPRSPWSSPIVLVAAAAGVLLVIAGVLAAFLLIPSSTSNEATTTPPTTVITTGGSTITSTVIQTPATTLPPATVPTTTETTHDNPSVPSTDWQGFTDGPRCNAAKDAAVAIGLTGRSRVVICQVGSTSGLYYKGLADGNAVEIQFPVRSGDTFTATNKGYSYIMSPASLTIARGGTVLTSEPMVAFWSN